jgi:general secretion pathway protein D/MSHA biogenesis protein MshL
MKTVIGIFLGILAVALSGCATMQTKEARVPTQVEVKSDQTTEPLVKERKGFLIPSRKEIEPQRSVYLPVGAQIQTRYGKVPMEKVLKELLSLKGYKLEAEKGVDLKAQVEVDIQPDDDFFKSLSSILAQADYSYELKEDTVLIKYLVTKKYNLPIPHVTQNFSTSVGGNLLGTGEAKGMMRGEVQVENKFKEPLDFWKMVEDNLKKIIGPEEKGVAMLVDRPLGIITITAPLTTQSKVAAYLKNLKKELFRQVIIEAKIIEVQLNKGSQMGIDWSGLAKTTLSGTIGQGGILYFRRNIIDQVTFHSVDFNLVLGALQNYGETKVLSSPRVTLMNGQTATLTVGENIRFIDKVETTSNTQTQTVSYSVSTSSILSGVGVAVLANILNSDEVVLYIVPITSTLREPIEYMNFGGTQAGSQVGLPRVKLKEMSTFARLRQGEALLIGGLIDKTQLKSETRVPILGSIPLLGNLFRYENVQDTNVELVIMLKPKIIDYIED